MGVLKFNTEYVENNPEKVLTLQAFLKETDDAFSINRGTVPTLLRMIGRKDRPSNSIIESFKNFFATEPIQVFKDRPSYLLSGPLSLLAYLAYPGLSEFSDDVDLIPGDGELSSNICAGIWEELFQTDHRVQSRYKNFDCNTIRNFSRKKRFPERIYTYIWDLQSLQAILRRRVDDEVEEDEFRVGEPVPPPADVNPQLIKRALRLYIMRKREEPVSAKARFAKRPRKSHSDETDEDDSDGVFKTRPPAKKSRLSVNFNEIMTDLSCLVKKYRKIRYLLRKTKKNILKKAIIATQVWEVLSTVEVEKGEQQEQDIAFPSTSKCRCNKKRCKCRHEKDVTMAVVMNEKAKSFASIDDEEDALLNEAICCSRNLEIKTDDDEDEEVTAPKPTKLGQLWSDINSDSNTSSNTSDLSVSNGKIDLSTDHPAALSVKEEPDIDNNDDNVIDIKHEPVDYIPLQQEQDGHLENNGMEDEAAESNGRNGKRVREDNDEYAQVPKNRRNSVSSSSTMSSTGKKPVEYETDPVVLARRQKDVDYGKNTIGYDRYTQEIPKSDRAKDHPRTPPMHLKCSRRAWDGMVKLWRKQLHFWDPKDDQQNEVNESPDEKESEKKRC